MKKKVMFKVPTEAIKYLVGNQHVGVSDSEIAALFKKKCKKAGATPAQAHRCALVAVGAHHRNQKLYTQVQRGVFGGRR